MARSQSTIPSHWAESTADPNDQVAAGQDVKPDA